LLLGAAAAKVTGSPATWIVDVDGVGSSSASASRTSL